MEVFHLLICPASKVNEGGLEGVASGSSLIEAGAGGDDQPRRLLALKLREQGKPFSRDFGVGQNIFDRSEFRFRKKERVRLPVKQTFIEQFLGMDAGTKDPNRVFDLGRDSGDYECLCWLNHVRKLDRLLRSLDCSKFARDWFALRNDF